MRGALVTLAVLLGATATEAWGQRTFPVTIESTPSGATIYIDDREKGPAGTTPYEGRLTAGDHVLVLELDGYDTAIEDIQVKKSRRPQTFSVELEEIAAVPIRVTAGSAKDAAHGATILLDGEEVGTVPATIEASVGPHQIQVVKEGHPPFEEWIEVIQGVPARLVASLGAAEVEAGGDGEGRQVVRPEGPRAQVMAGARVGWRSFRYQAPRAGPLRPFDATWVGMARVDVALHPALGWYHVPILRKVSVIGTFSRAFPLEANTDGGMEAIDTVWSEMELGARVPLGAGEDARVDVDLAYGRTLFTFRDAGTFADELPDVDYRFLRLGARAVKMVGQAELFVGADAMAPLSSGPLAARFGGARVYGFSVSGGALVPLWGQAYAHALAGWTRFAYRFESDPGDDYDAAGGSDTMFGASLSAAYRF